MVVGGVRRNLNRPQDNQSSEGVFERKSTGVGSGLNSKVGKRPFGAVGHDIISGGSYKANQTIE
jgi:hypothetical protein